MFWRLLLDKTLSHAQEKTAPGRKTSKERVTFLACRNADGSHKVKMLVIGKSQNPRCLKNAVIPVEYKATKNAWMTALLFQEWFQHSFVKQVRAFLRTQNMSEKALLLVDNAPSHASEQLLVSDDGKIVNLNVYFFIF